MVKNPPANARDTGSIPGQGTKIPYATEQLSPLAATTESTHHNERSRMTQQRCVLQLRADADK